MTIGRLLTHLLMPPWRVRRVFTAAGLRAIETTISDCESTHTGEIRIAIEHALHPLAVLRKQTARERAIEVFSQLRVWDTAHNNGVLIYLLLADRSVEIVADRGIHTEVGQEPWEQICRDMEAAFRTGNYQGGVIAGIRSIGAHLSRHYPAGRQNDNELPDAPVLV